MKCVDPQLCFYLNGEKHFRHFSFAKNSVLLSAKVKHDVYDCGKCLPCRKKKATDLAVRCVLHSSLYEDNCFLTLTYDERHPRYHNEFEYPDIQLFKKNLRAYAYRDLGRRIDIFNVHEYGKNGKKHWHVIVFNYCPEVKTRIKSRSSHPLYASLELSSLWTHGLHSVGDVSEASAMYQAKYMEKDFRNRYVTTSKKSHSMHRGIGKPYFLKHYKQILSLGYVPFGKRKLPLPRTFEKIAHKHYCHFYEPSAFIDNMYRKALYTPISPGDENREMAELYIAFRKNKDLRILELEKEWDLLIDQYLTSKDDPGFIRSGENALYDLRNKNHQERF